MYRIAITAIALLLSGPSHAQVIGDKVGGILSGTSEDAQNAKRQREGLTRGPVIVSNPGERKRRETPAREEFEKADRDAEKLILPRSQHPINLPIIFGFDSWALGQESRPQLDHLCKALTDSADVPVFIIGHTDATGPERHNAVLSMLRAEELVLWLVDECGVAPGRLQAVGMGEADPLPDFGLTASRQRRVEVLVAPDS